MRHRKLYIAYRVLHLASCVSLLLWELRKGSIKEWMAKKKQSSPSLVLTSPFSPKTVLMVVGIIIGLLAINGISFEKFQRDEQEQATLATKNLLTTVSLRTVLGSTTETEAPANDETQFRKNPEAKYWYDVLSLRPDYRDAYITLATLAYNDHRCKLAQTYVLQAYQLDPNMPKDTPIALAVEKCGK